MPNRLHRLFHSPERLRLARCAAADQDLSGWESAGEAFLNPICEIAARDYDRVMSGFVRIAGLVLCGLGALAMSACMTLPASSNSSPSGLSFGPGAPSSSFSSSGYSNGGSASGYSSSSAAAAASPNSSYSAGAPADSGSVPPGYTNDTAQSGTLTSYLQSHRLPLVGAQVLTNNSGDQQIILYGFVASDFGKQDAADRARQYLHNPNAPVVNRIAVRPELASGNGGSAPSAPSNGTPDGGYGSAESSGSGNALGNAQSYQDQEQQAQQQRQYMQQTQQSPSGLTAIVPLIGMMGMLSMGSGGGLGIGGGGYAPSYGSPYGASPYASPYGSPYSPYGATPYAPSYGYPRSFP